MMIAIKMYCVIWSRLNYAQIGHARYNTSIFFLCVCISVCVCVRYFDVFPFYAFCIFATSQTHSLWDNTTIISTKKYYQTYIYICILFNSSILPTTSGG